MARWKLAMLAMIALVPMLLYDYHQGRWNGMTVGAAAFSIVMLVTPRAIVQRKWFAITTGVVLVALPFVVTLASGRWKDLPVVLGIMIVLGYLTPGRILGRTTR